MSLQRDSVSDSDVPTATDPTARRLDGRIGYARGFVLSGPEVGRPPFLVNTMASHLAATVLTTDSRAATRPELLRRALAFIDRNAHTDITVADIARHVYVTPRALQYMFRRHVDCTPTEYLRRVRLEYAHAELVVATRSNATVATIARRWGFTHVGRFAVYYRQTYGRSPHSTLWN